SQPLRRRLAHSIDGADLVRHRVAGSVEPTPAAESMDPPLAMHALRVRAIEEVLTPNLVARGLRIGPLDMRLAARREFVLVPVAAPRASDQKHPILLMRPPP